MNIALKSLEGIAIAAMSFSLSIFLWQMLDLDGRIYLSVLIAVTVFSAIAVSRYFWGKSNLVFTLWIYALIGFTVAVLPNFTQWVLNHASS